VPFRAHKELTNIGPADVLQQGVRRLGLNRLISRDMDEAWVLRETVLRIQMQILQQLNPGQSGIVRVGAEGLTAIARWDYLAHVG